MMDVCTNPVLKRICEIDNFTYENAGHAHMFEDLSTYFSRLKC